MNPQSHQATSVPDGAPVGEDVFNTRGFRDALGRFATGVVVVTASSAQAGPLGMTISSFNPVSLQPPLVLFSVSRQAHSLPGLLAAAGYAVHVLDQAQSALSSRFAGTMGTKWHDVAHRPGLHNAPLLNSVLAWFECAAHAHHDGGDPVIFLARVVRFTMRPAGEPRVFFGGRYRALAPAGKGMPE